MFNTLLKMFIVAMLCLYSGSIEAQSPIRRKGTSGNKTTSVQREKTRKKAPVRRRSLSIQRNEDLSDSIAVAEDDDDDRLKVLQTASGFPMMGRIRPEYTDKAEGQKTIREALKNYTNVKVACLTNHKAIFVYGGNGYQANGLNSEMIEALKFCNKNKYTINDVAVTDIGWWCIIYEQKKYKGSIPEKCKIQLDKYIKEGENIVSISISENGDFAIVTDNHFSASNEFDLKAMEIAQKNFGKISSVCVTNDGIIVTCEEGIFFWDIPSNIIENIEKGNGAPTVVRFTDSGTHIALDGKGLKLYYM